MVSRYFRHCIIYYLQNNCSENTWKNSSFHSVIRNILLWDAAFLCSKFILFWIHKKEYSQYLLTAIFTGALAVYRKQRWFLQLFFLTGSSSAILNYCETTMNVFSGEEARNPTYPTPKQIKWDKNVFRRFFGIIRLHSDFSQDGITLRFKNN